MKMSSPWWVVWITLFTLAALVVFAATNNAKLTYGTSTLCLLKIGNNGVRFQIRTLPGCVIG
jgi:hypothetical protein